MGETRPPLLGNLAKKRNKKRKFEAESHDAMPRRSKGQSPVLIDALAWRSISMPDKLDDYEGFLDLEEVDNVDVVREEATGKVTYVAKPAIDSVNGYDPGDPEDHSEDAWNGFESDVVEPVNRLTPPANGKKQKKTKPAQEAANGDASASKRSGKSASAFATLQDMTDTSECDVSAWQPYKLSPDTLASLSRLKFTEPTPIQRAVIPEILAGCDVIGKAPTGSGKTLAFGIPILERFLELRSTQQKPLNEHAPLALILSPTRELAHQLDKHLTALCSNGVFDRPLIATLTGGLSVQKQQRLLKKADIVIGTPGRLWEVVSGGQGILDSLKKIQFLIIDEADRLLSDGHFKELEQILDALERVEHDIDDYQTTQVLTKPPRDTSERQTLVFSATFDRGLQTKLASRQKISRSENNLMNKQESMEYLLSKLPFRDERPKFVDVNPINQLAAGLREGLIECGATEKDLYLYTVILLNSNARTLVFTNSISAVRRLTPFLQTLDLPALALHSGMPQKARLRSIERFTQVQKSRNGSILVATDVAARGLDIPNVQRVIHYHLPRTADTYVHRSGRTARAGAGGSSIILCGPEEAAGVRRLVAKVHAQSALTSASQSKRQGYFIRTLDLDRRIVTRLKPRAKLAKQIADASIAKEKEHHQNDFFRNAAEELGVDYDSEELDRQDSGRRGRGAGRKQRERSARSMTKAEVGALRAELKSLLQERVNVGVSERYLTSGNVDIDELLRQREAGLGKTGEFLGRLDGIMGLDDG